MEILHTKCKFGGCDEKINGDIIHKIQVGWLKWKKVMRFMCNHKVSPKLKWKLILSN